LLAGRPQLVTPFFADQFDNAERVARLGVARICKGAAATAETLGRELAQLLADERIAERAEAAATEVAREEGALVAARRIAALPGLRRGLEQIVP
jgi:UDP:flavonoid glycosyltransferase YjiC (YdhE family)